MKNFILLFVASLFILSCQQPESSKWTTIKYIQEPPVLVHLNLGDTSHSHGDGMAFEAAIKDTAGNAVGEVIGWLVTVDIVEGDSSNPIHATEKIGSMIFDFGDENEIICQGGTTYHDGEKIMKLGLSQKRAITGGTGKYKGVEGEVTTTRNEDGTYTHLLDIKLDN